MAARQQALLEEAEKRDQELKEKLRNRLTYTNENERVGDSRSRAWKLSVVAGNPPVKENSKHPFSLAILSEELPKKFKYPTDMEPYDGSSDPKHHLDAFDNMMVLLNALDATKLPKTCLNLYSIVKKPEESLRDYLDRFNSECTQIEGLECQATLMALVKGLREDTPFLKSLTNRPPKTMEEIQERSHDYLQQEEGQTAVKTDRDKKEAGRKDLLREDRIRREQRSSRSYYNPLNVSLITFLHEVS
ncbi:hypothetical protein PIB30_054848 [Stylosanthes scabra]|uniref:Uncharacterized protein n=1 Tax=Stylosanthes scabra TaxID=79078 RepID=A0ABU6TJG9_9FABA|nr:hypothetical protein [Stylosanthes scabra]